MAISAILVAVDEGHDTDQVLALATSMALAFSAKTHVLTVADVPGMAATSDLAVEASEERARQVARAALERLAESGVTAESHVADGSPAKVIAALARSLGCDLIVIGHRHMSLLGRVFDPSVCDDLLDHTSCPVLVVPGSQ